MNSHGNKHALALISKIPHVNRSKTRLIPYLGTPEAARGVAEALLFDTLSSLNDIGSDTDKLLFYRSFDKDLEETFLYELYCRYPSWRPFNLQGLAADQNSLGHILADVLDNLRIHYNTRYLFLYNEARFLYLLSVTFIGSDTPYLPVQEVLEGQAIVERSRSEAYLCPAEDGGYVLLTLSSSASPSVFNNV